MKIIVSHLMRNDDTSMTFTAPVSAHIRKRIQYAKRSVAIKQGKAKSLELKRECRATWNIIWRYFENGRKRPTLKLFYVEERNPDFRARHTISEDEGQELLEVDYVLEPERENAKDGTQIPIPSFHFPQTIVDVKDLIWEDNGCLTLSVTLTDTMVRHACLYIHYQNVNLRDHAMLKFLPSEGGWKADHANCGCKIDLVQDHLLNGRWIWITHVTDESIRHIDIWKTSRWFDARKAYVLLQNSSAYGEKEKYLENVCPCIIHGRSHRILLPFRRSLETLSHWNTPPPKPYQSQWFEDIRAIDSYIGGLADLAVMVQEAISKNSPGKINRK